MIVSPLGDLSLWLAAAHRQKQGHVAAYSFSIADADGARRDLVRALKVRLNSGVLSATA